jgi:hypothetical protein
VCERPFLQERESERWPANNPWYFLHPSDIPDVALCAQPYVVRGGFNDWGNLGDLVLNDIGGGNWSAP